MLPLGLGAIDQAETGPIAFLGQPMPDGDFTVEAKINAPGLEDDDSRTDDPYAQLGLGLFQTDGDWIGVYHTRNGDNGSTNDGTYFEVKSETERRPDALAARRPGPGPSTCRRSSCAPPARVTC